MSRTTKIWLITAAFLLLIGCMIFGSVMTMLKWDFTKLSTNSYETNRYEINEGFSAISIHVDTADVVLVPAETETCVVVCYEQKNCGHTVSVKDGELVIELVDTRKWYEHIGIGLESSKITVYLPQAEYSALSVKSDTGDVEVPSAFCFQSIDISGHTGDVKNYASAVGAVTIGTTTGSIFVENVSVGSLALSVSTGKVTVLGVASEGDASVNVSTGKTVLTDMTCKNLISRGNTGDISLKNVVVAETMSIERSTGDVRFDASDAAEIFVKTDTGDVLGTLLSEKVFVVKTDTGRIDVPGSTAGGKCEITTDTGDICIRV
ncbi:MAG: DUF4097 family beta strand repeat protein [Clostridia bacterium]|nr:DUF4097 family beta strand repeat protein [Clostridia bacterium]